MKKFQSILALMLCIFLLCSCHDDQNPASSDPQTAPSTTAPSSETSYSVTVLDAAGKPIDESIIVHFIQNGQTVAMQPVNGDGVAQKVLPTGDYTVELAFADGDAAYCYDDSNLKLDPDNVSLSVVMYGSLGDLTQELSAYSESTGEHRSYVAYYISDGYTFMSLDTDDRNYVLFMPAQPGLYEFSVSGDAAIGYYGMPHYVQSYNLGEMTDEDTFTVNVTPGMIGSSETSGSTVLVLGIDSNDQSDCVVSIQRIGDYVPTIEELPWDIYQTTAALSPYTLNDNLLISEFDLTAESDAYALVLNEQDGFFHLGTPDGPLVLAKLGADSAYLDSIETILETSGISKFYFDEDGTCTRKESYSECLTEYISNMDEASGLYPLTQDLVYIFQSRGEYVGWWDVTSPTYLFKDDSGKLIPGINSDIAWLFLCCYAEEMQVPEDPCADGHTFGSWTQIKAPTTQEEGLASRECSVCGHTEQKKLNKLEQSDDPIPEPEPEPEPSIGTPSGIDPYETGVVESFTTTVAAGTYNDYILYRVNGTIVLTVRSEDAYVIYNGKTYWPENGVITLEIKAKSMMAPVELSIGNSGTKDAEFTVLMGNPVGSLMNPSKLVLGTFTTKTTAGDEQGYYYEYTATTDGTLTISLVSVDVDANCDFTLQSLDVNRVDGYQLSTSGTVSLNVKAGETVRITIGVYTDGYEYPAATVVATATFD